ncbi:MAG: hypothetical protein NT116_01000, partial [Candidatus Parcubacteria bacterium]|nr:hypothetical protein [Candidatus Parcubacteria bacterium]
MPKSKYKPVILAILDGWGVAPDSPGNAITRAKLPNYKKYISTYPAMTLMASGDSVGLPWGEIGNSEVGHTNLGSGFIFYQTCPRITKTISDGSFYKNEAFLKAIEHAKKNKSKLHLMGLISSGGVHSHIEHLYALLELAKKEKIKQVYIHGFMDGRDTIYNSGKKFIEELNFRSDRARQISETFVLPEFSKFDRKIEIKNLFYCAMYLYDKDLPLDSVAFYPFEIKMPLAKV